MPRMSVRACFYLILAILNYFSLSSVSILTIMLLNFFLKSDLFLSYTNRRCANMPRMSVGACFYLILAFLNYFNLSSVFILTIHAFKLSSYNLIFFCLILTDAELACLECP